VLRAVLIDMDGTLLDSERVWDLALDELAGHLGGTLSAAARQSMVGSSLWRSVATVHEDLGVEADPVESAGYLTARTARLFRTHLAWKPGAQDLLVALADAQLPVALVTSTYRVLTDIALEFIGRQFFAATVCGDEVTRPKPAPDPYLRAAELLSVDPADCVAIEDSPLGIASAAAAGCVVVAVPSEVPVDPQTACAVVGSLREVDVAFLGRLV